MCVDIILSFAHKKDINIAYDLGCDLWAYPDKLKKKKKKGPWHSESELQSFLSKKNHSPDKLGGVRLRIYVGECAQIKHSSKKGQS